MRLVQPFVRNQWRSIVAVTVASLGLAGLWTYSCLEAEGYRSLLSRPSYLNHHTQADSCHFNDASCWSSHDADLGKQHLISPKIWQILLSKGRSRENQVIDAGILQDTVSWLAMNPDYTYTLVDDDGAKSFFEYHMPHRQDLTELYNNLPNVGMKSDLLRYLILHAEGGVYSDTDTIALKPIDIWVPRHLRHKVRLIVGIEFDRRDGGGWADIPHWLQFCQWTIAAAPGHPVFEKMIDRVVESAQTLSEQHEAPINELRPSSFEVMNSTGPAAWTDVIFEHLQQHDPTLKETKDLSFMTEPKLYGDILVLTIDGFGMGQSHSHSTHDGSIPEAALMRHLFRGSWRQDESDHVHDE